MKETAVEFLVKKLKSQGLLIGETDNLIAVKEAKEMEMLQITEAFDDGFENQCDADLYYSKKFKPDYF